MHKIHDRLARDIAVSISVALALIVLMSVTVRGDTLVGHWKFDGDFSDSVGSNDATKSAGNNEAFAGTSNGKIGGAVDFDGDQDGLTLPNAKTQLIADNTYSLAFWEWSRGAGNTGYFICSGPSAGYEGFFFRRDGANPGNYNGQHGNDGAGTVIANSVSRENWHHVVLTVDSSEVARLYVDGEFKDSEAVPNKVHVNLDSALWLGRRKGDFLRDFDGLLDDLQIYDDALTGAQAQWLFNHPGQAIPEPGMLIMLVCAGLTLAALRQRRR
ncbi:MAG: LamG domain-containing protein [Planctomycetota bacterium]|nr:LamG domain-containing protein [Planctomycetota bacterium]